MPTDTEPTMVELLTEHFYESDKKTSLGQAHHEAEQREFPQIVVRVDWSDQGSMTAFSDSVFHELVAIRSALYLLASRLDAEGPIGG